jgi:ABC-type transport system involved in cytochrome bd biosynthesis fused ATPase/permease subunit
VYLGFDADRAARVAKQFGIQPVAPLAVIALCCLAALAVFRVRDAWLAYAGVLATILAFTGYVVYPRIDAARSGRAFTERVQQASAGIQELALVGAKEQYLLQLKRPSFNFGHARWRERESEAADAAAWLAEDPQRGLVMDKRVRELCFKGAQAVDLGKANRQHWYLVTGNPDPKCVAEGDRAAARLYAPPDEAFKYR